VAGCRHPPGDQFLHCALGACFHDGQPPSPGPSQVDEGESPSRASRRTWVASPPAGTAVPLRYRLGPLARTCWAAEADGPLGPCARNAFACCRALAEARAVHGTTCGVHPWQGLVGAAPCETGMKGGDRPRGWGAVSRSARSPRHAGVRRSPNSHSGPEQRLPASGIRCTRSRPSAKAAGPAFEKVLDAGSHGLAQERVANRKI